MDGPKYYDHNWNEIETPDESQEIEYKPVVHGRMEIHSTYIRCSACDERFALIPFPCYYCPNCGAKVVNDETNADRIRAMTDEELADWLTDMHDNVTCPNNGALDCNPSCKWCWLDWLKQEVDDG